MGKNSEHTHSNLQTTGLISIAGDLSALESDSANHSAEMVKSKAIKAKSVQENCANDVVLPLDLGRFCLTEEIARGGMGIIYLGQDSTIRREVAVKTMLLSHIDNPSLQKRFQNETFITAVLEHPGVTPVYDTGNLPDGRHFFAMEVIRGQTLSEIVNESTNLVEQRPRLLKIFEQICRTIAFAHSNEVIHRDLKSINICVADHGVVKVLDWGIAKIEPFSKLYDSSSLADVSSSPRNAWGTATETESCTWSGQVMGTPSFMSPEQARGEMDLVDKRSDVFGLGAILCEILTGLPPYTGKSKVKLIEQASCGRLEAAQQRLEACGAEPILVELALRCLSSNPNHRPHDANQVADTFTAYIESELRRAERDLVRFFELSLDMFCICGFDGFFKRVNDNFSRILDVDSKDLLSQPFMNFVHPEDIAGTMSAMSCLLDGREVVRFRNRYVSATGVVKVFEWTAKSLPEEGLIFAVARDVS